VERQLKHGLLGTAVTAYFNNVRRGEPYRRIYVVPMTINYRLVLEAETLISDYLAETGKSRYIIEDDEFSRVGRMAEFMRKILAHEGAVVLRFGMPRDPFGNLTDEAGESLDRRGRPVDPASFLRGADGEYRSDPQRDAEYTRTLGAALVTDYRRLTVFLSTHLLARALFDAVTVRARTRDIYRLLRLAGSTEAVPIGEIEQRIEVLRRRIAASPAWGSVHTAVATCPVADLVADALRALGTYHTRPVAQRIGNQVVASDMELLYYYQNRTDHVPVEESP
jgi:glycerol-3-phosphate O-acyltransferase